MRFVLRQHARAVLATVSFVLLAVACVTQSSKSIQLHGWWNGLGPVLPHDSFPADCGLCHVGSNWGLTTDFSFDHEAQTGYALEGAHNQAQCLRCHNDRGPVTIFTAQGCAGCHEEVHFGKLGSDCLECHTQVTWNPYGQIERHNQTRFPLVGTHAATSCRHCHQGAEVGNFLPTDIECITCHQDDLLRAVNPPHIGLGYVDNCQRCHLPTTWQQAELND
jgi:hypothetical protein